MAEEKSPKLRKGFSWYAWVNSGCGFGTQLICLYCTMVWGYCIAAVATQLGVEKTDLALAASIYGVCYAGLSFVWGIMADRIGLRKTLTVSHAGVGVFLVLFSFTATSVMGVIITYALVGVFVSALGSAVYVYLFSTWFHANTRSRGMMIAGFGGSAASLTAGLIFPQLLLSFGWQMCFQVLGVIALVVCVIVFLLGARLSLSIRISIPYGMTEQEGLAYVEAMEEQQGDVKDGKGKPSFKDVLKSPVTWGFGVIMVLFQFYMMSTTTYRTAAIVDSGFTIVEAGLWARSCRLPC